MTRAITKNDVLAYLTGLMTDPAGRATVEAARETDPVVRRYFSLLSGEAYGDVPAVYRAAGRVLAERWLPEPVVPVLTDPKRGTTGRAVPGFRYAAQIEWGYAKGDTGRVEPPPLAPPTDLPYEVDLDARVVRFTYPASVVPLGVARVSAEIAGNRVGETLAVFRLAGAGGAATREAEVPLTELGISLEDDSDPEFVVVPAGEDTLAEFDPVRVRRLRERCNGDRELRAAVELLLSRLSKGGV